MPYENWFFGLCLIWMSLDIVIFATAWYLVTTIKPRYPGWWRRTIVDEESRLTA